MTFVSFNSVSYSNFSIKMASHLCESGSNESCVSVNRINDSFSEKITVVVLVVKFRVANFHNRFEVIVVSYF